MKTVCNVTADKVTVVNVTLPVVGTLVTMTLVTPTWPRGFDPPPRPPPHHTKNAVFIYRSARIVHLLRPVYTRLPWHVLYQQLLPYCNSVRICVIRSVGICYYYILCHVHLESYTSTRVV